MVTSSRLSRPIRCVVTPILFEMLSISASRGFRKSNPMINTFLLSNESIAAVLRAQKDFPSPEIVDVNAIMFVLLVFFMKKGIFERIPRNDSAIEDFGLDFTGITSV